ncbi:MAG: ImmA/IrrE family metallo-endopeptidase, partial [Pseudomonadota bacterium]|nr:ImmA/IrrE family metallo-endopeptidase [Pseudomonadota bacterium]
DNRAYRSTGEGRFHNRNIGPAQETQANRFAATLLMPNNMVADLRAAGFDRRGMAEKLGVSEHAMAIRLGEPYP